MKRVEIFCNSNCGTLQEMVNEFCREHNVTDIKMSESEQDITVMVIYEVARE